MSNSSTSAKQRPAKAKGKSAWSKGPPRPQTSAPSPHSQSPTPSASTSTQSQAHSRRPSALGQAVPIKDGVSVPRGNIGAAAAKQDLASIPIPSSLAAPSVITSLDTVPDAPGILATPPNGSSFGGPFSSKNVGSIASSSLPSPPSSTRRLSANSPTFVPRATPSHSTAWSSGPGSPSRGPGPSEEQRKKRRAEEAAKRMKKEEERKKKEQEETEQKRQAEEEEKAKERLGNAEEERKRLEETERQKREAEVSFSTARYIENINAIKYPEGIQGPKSELNENATAGHIRYDRDFLLQFWSFCKARPPNLARLDAIGLDPNDPVVLERIRALPGRHRDSLPALLSRHLPVGPGLLGGGSAFGVAAPDTIDDIGNFGRAAKLTSEEQFSPSHSTAWSSGPMLPFRGSVPSVPKRLEENERQKREAESSFSTAHYIENINAIKYPEGIQGPKSELSENATAGHIRYDRDFLLQFRSFCKAKPPNLARLDVLGLEPRDPAVLVTRGGSGRHRNNNTLAAPLPHHSLVGPGLGGGLGFGIAAASSFGSMGNFGSRANLTSEERFAMARAGNPSVSGIPFVAGHPPTQETASQGGDVQVNVLLNELLTENFDSISDQIIARANKSRQERDGHSLIEVIRHLLGKAIDEPTRSDIYARLCRKMMPRISPQIQIDGIMNAQGKPIAGGQLIRKFLLDHCKGDFDRRWAGKETTADAAAAEDDAAKVADAGKDADTEEVALNSDEDPAVQRAKLQGVIKFMGELFKVKLLTEPIMHEYVKKFLGGDAENPEEEKMESLCTLLTTVGAVLDTPKARAHMNNYFSRVKEFAQSPNVSPRVQLMLQDLTELRERHLTPQGECPSSSAQPFGSVWIQSHCPAIESVLMRFGKPYIEFLVFATKELFPTMSGEPSTTHTEEATPDNGPSTSSQTFAGAEERVLSSPELTTMIFEFLKEKPNSGVGIVSDQLPTFKDGKWRPFFANLARVNRAFFHASITILWETMDTLKPFFELILPCDTLPDSTKPVVPLTYWSSISSDQWKRFETYSSRTKTLVLNRKKSPEIDPSWLFYISSSTRRPLQLFPATRNLFLTSNDTLSLFVAFHVVPQLDTLCIQLDKESEEPDNESAVAFVSSVAENAGKLNSLRLVRPTSWKILKGVAAIPTLKKLYLRIEKSTYSAQLARLNKLHSLQVLYIHQSAQESALSNAFPDSVGTADAIAQESRMKNVTDLSVKANCTKQFQVATQLSLNSLRTLNLDVLADVTGSMAVLPLFLLIHAQRNPQLTSLVVTCRKFRIKPEWVADMRGDSRYTVMGPFINALASLGHLTTLSITGASFFAVDIIVQMLHMLPKLPQLQVFRFIPRQLTALEADELVTPSLGALEEVSRHNPNLRELAIALDIFELDNLVIPHGYLSRHGLKKLTIFTWDDEEIAITTEDNLHMARYLDRLFPSLETLTEEWAKDTWDWKTWNAIEKMLSFCQEIRAQALNDAKLMAS